MFGSVLVDAKPNFIFDSYIIPLLTRLVYSNTLSAIYRYRRGERPFAPTKLFDPVELLIHERSLL